MLFLVNQEFTLKTTQLIYGKIISDGASYKMPASFRSSNINKAKRQLKKRNERQVYRKKNTDFIEKISILEFLEQFMIGAFLITLTQLEKTGLADIIFIPLEN